MILHLFCILLAAATQRDALFTGAVPATVPTFVVTVGSGPPVYAGLRVDGQWVTDHRTEFKSTQVVELVPDTPLYAGEPTRTLFRNVELVYEAPAMRRTRLEEIWTSQGYTFLETSAGWRAVKKTDIHLAERARELMRLSAESPATAMLTPTVTTPSESGQPESGTGLLWSARLGIPAAALIFLALLYRFWGREKDGWSRIE